MGLFNNNSEGENLKLCVKLVGEEPYETPITLAVKSLETITVNKGDSRVLLWGDQKTFTFAGYGINAEEDEARFVLASSVKDDEE